MAQSLGFFRLSVSICVMLAFGGCRHKEAKPSAAVYEAAVATSAEPTKKAERAMPVRQASSTTAAASGDKLIVKVPLIYAVCTGHNGPYTTIGPLVYTLSQLAESSQLKVLEQNGVRLEGRGEKWRVCLPVSENKAPAVTLPGRSVVRLSHKGDYGVLLARKSELLKWLRSQSRQAIMGSPVVITLFDDPSVVDVTKLRSTLELEVLPK